jgi:23S rRNA (uracil1939-C5)-methyltransferase
MTERPEEDDVPAAGSPPSPAGREGSPEDRGGAVEVHSIGSGGVGVGTLPDGRVVFLPRTAPGDRVRVELVEDRKRWARGEVVEYLTEGPGRRTPPCPLYYRCDGCALQHLRYPEQCRWKGRMVGDALRRIGKREVDDPPVEASPLRLHYRNKMTFTLRRSEDGRVVAGLHDRLEKRAILDVGGECLLPGREIVRGWVALRAAWGPKADRLPEGEELRLTLRSGTGGRAPDGGTPGRERLGLVVAGGRGDGDPAALLNAVDGLTSVWREEEPGRVRHVAGEPMLPVLWLGRRFSLPGGAFLQVNEKGGQALHARVLEEAGDVDGLRVVEGYAGLGILGSALAERGARVVAVENEPTAVERARESVSEGPCTGGTPGQGEPGRERPEEAGEFRMERGRLEDELERLLPADLLLVNPPRTGLHEDIPDLLRRRTVPRIVYVSCDPATLARDIRRLGSGYTLESLHSFDLFPQTGHVETVAILSNGEGVAR